MYYKVSSGRRNNEVKAGITKIKPQLKKFGAEHKEYSELCERFALVMNSSPGL